MRIEIRKLQQTLKLTTVMVTHDQEEALTMADRLVVMSDGAVRQVGSQRDLYERPADRFVAGFVGRSSFLEGALETPERFRSRGGIAVACRPTSVATGSASLALRPERVTVAPEAIAGAENGFMGEVEFVSYLGGLIDLHVRLSPSDLVIAQIPNREDGFMPRMGDKVHVGWTAASATVFPGSGGSADSADL